MVGLACDGDTVGEPARLAPHRLHDEPGAGRHGVGSEVEELLRHEVDGGKEAEGEVDAVVVVVDRLRQVNDLKPGGLLGEPPLVLVEKVCGLQRVIAPDGDELVDAEVGDRAVDLEPERLAGVVEVVGPAMPLPGLAREVPMWIPRTFRMPTTSCSVKIR